MTRFPKWTFALCARSACRATAAGLLALLMCNSASAAFVDITTHAFIITGANTQVNSYNELVNIFDADARAGIPYVSDIGESRVLENGSQFGTQATARSTAGSLGVFADVSAFAPQENGAIAYAGAMATFNDTLRFQGALPDTTIRLLLQSEILVSASRTNAGFGFFSSMRWGNDRAWNVCFGEVLTSCGLTPNPNYGPVGVPSPLLLSFQDIYEISAGTELLVSSNLQGIAQAGDGNAFSVAGVNSLNSLRNGISILTPGVSLLSDSGHNYVFAPHAMNAVPEPNSAILLLTVLAVAGFARRTGSASRPR